MQNNQTIELINNEKLSHNFVYNSWLVEILTLKSYIKTILANNFLKLFKSTVNAYNFFVKKSLIIFVFL